MLDKIANFGFLVTCIITVCYISVFFNNIDVVIIVKEAHSLLV